MIRSLGNWSGGFKCSRTEASILAAYLDAIQNAEHFIYIEVNSCTYKYVIIKLISNRINSSCHHCQTKECSIQW